MMLFGIMFNAVDVAAMIIVVSGFLLGLRRGLSRELFRFLNVVIILLVGLRFYLPFGDLLIANAGLSQNREEARAVAFLLIIVLLGLCLLIVRVLFQLVVKAVFRKKPVGRAAFLG